MFSSVDRPQQTIADRIKTMELKIKNFKMTPHPKTHFRKSAWKIFLDIDKFFDASDPVAKAFLDIIQDVRETVFNGASTKYHREFSHLNPRKFKPLGPIPKLRFLERAYEFLQAGIYLGPFFEPIGLLYGIPTHFWPVFSIDRPDKPLTPRLIHNAAATQPGAPVCANDAIVLEYTDMARLIRIAILALNTTWCFKVDLATAFHQIKKVETQWALQGIFVECSDFDLALFDTTLPMGFRDSPAVFNKVVKAFYYTLALYLPSLYLDSDHGLLLDSMLDDIWGGAQSMSQSYLQMSILMVTGMLLGIKWNLEKTDLPAQVQKIYGFIFHFLLKTIEVPEDKLEKMRKIVKEVLSLRHRIPLKLLQSCKGLWVWMGNLILTIRSFTTVWSEAECLAKRNNNFFAKTQDPQLWADFRNDLQTLSRYLHTGIKVDISWFLNIVPESKIVALTDASGKYGIGGWTQSLAWQLSWFEVAQVFKSVFGLFEPEWMQVWPIHVHELLASVVSFFILAPKMKGLFYRAKSDNSTAVIWLNKGRAGKRPADKLIQAVWTRLVADSSRVTWSHIPGDDNTLADDLSRKHMSEVLLPNHVSPTVVVRPVRILKALAEDLASKTKFFQICKKLALAPNSKPVLNLHLARPTEQVSTLAFLSFFESNFFSTYRAMTSQVRLPAT